MAINPEQLGEDTPEDMEIQYVELSGVVRPGASPVAHRMAFGNAPSRARRRARRGDILVSTVRPYLRGFTRVRDECENLVASTGFAVLRPNGRVGGDFIYQHILSDRFIKHLLPALAGSNYPAVNPEIVGNYPVLVPPTEERKRIAEILTGVDEAVEHCRAVIQQARIARDGAMDFLIRHGIPGRHKDLRHVPGIGAVPESWATPRIGDVFDVQLGKMLSEKSTRGASLRPYVGNVAVQWEHCNVTDLPAMDFSPAEFRKFELRSGDILVCEGGEAGRTAIWRGEVPGCCFQKAVHRLRTRDGTVLPQFFVLFMQWALRHNYFRPWTIRSSIAHLTRETLVEVPILLPPQDEQAAIVETVAGLPITKMADHLAVLEDFKSTLAESLLSGRVAVPTEKGVSTP